jgi:hypothetical protein
MHEAFMGVPATGQRIELPGISIFHFRNGQCFERWTCSDSLVLLITVEIGFAGLNLARTKEYMGSRSATQ